MNKSLAVPNEGSWPLGPLAPDKDALPGQRTYSATNILDFPTLLRIIHHWRWLVVGGVALGLVGAILFSVLTTPIYRAWVTLEANPPTVAVSDEQSRERDATTINSYDFVATQVGLLSSKSVAERTAQELNLVNNPNIVGQDADASKRLRTATAVVARGLEVIAPDQGTIDQVQLRLSFAQLAAIVANGVADSFIDAVSSAAVKPPRTPHFLERQIARPTATSSTPSARSPPLPRRRDRRHGGRRMADPPSETRIRSRGNRSSRSTRALADATRAGSPPKAHIVSRLQLGRRAM